MNITFTLTNDPDNIACNFQVNDTTTYPVSPNRSVGEFSQNELQFFLFFILNENLEKSITTPIVDGVQSYDITNSGLFEVFLVGVPTQSTYNVEIVGNSDFDSFTNRYYYDGTNIIKSDNTVINVEGSTDIVTFLRDVVSNSATTIVQHGVQTELKECSIIKCLSNLTENLVQEWSRESCVFCENDIITELQRDRDFLLGMLYLIDYYRTITLSDSQKLLLGDIMDNYNNCGGFCNQEGEVIKDYQRINNYNFATSGRYSNLNDNDCGCSR